MPTEARIEAAAAEITERLESVGYDVGPFETPDEHDGDDGTSYLYASYGDDTKFYVTFYDDSQGATVVYPFTVTRSLGYRLTEDERVAVVASETDRDDLEQTPEAGTPEETAETAGRALARRCDPSLVPEIRFRLADYASSPPVAVDVSRSDDGFPVKFRSYTTLLPYSDRFGHQSLASRLDAVLTTGRNGRRYVRDALRVDTSGDPAEYHVDLRF